MQGRRADRISTLIQEEISRLILQSVKDPRIRCVTVTRVRVSDDLRCAKIYIAPMGDGEQQRREALAGLTRAGGFLRGELGRRLCLRYVPELDFCLMIRWNRSCIWLSCSDRLKPPGPRSHNDGEPRRSAPAHEGV